MRKKRQKNRCTKISLEKCQKVCTCYDKLMEAFARLLAVDENVAEFSMNIPLDFTKVNLSADLLPPVEPHMTDFLIKYRDGSMTVKETVFRRTLGNPSTIEKLQLSKEYWSQKGVTDWGIIIEKATESTEEKGKYNESK